MEDRVFLLWSTEHYRRNGKRYETVYDAASGTMRGTTRLASTPEAYKAEWADAVSNETFPASKTITFKTLDGVLDSIEDQIERKNLTPEEAERTRRAFDEFCECVRPAPGAPVSSNPGAQPA